MYASYWLLIVHRKWPLKRYIQGHRDGADRWSGRVVAGCGGQSRERMVLEHFPFGRIQQCLAIGQSRIWRKSGQVAQKTALQVVRNLDEFIDHPPAKLVMGEPVVRRDPEVIYAPAGQAQPGPMLFERHGVAPGRANLADRQDTADGRRADRFAQFRQPEDDVFSGIGRGVLQDHGRGRHTELAQLGADDVGFGLGLTRGGATGNEQLGEHAPTPQTVGFVTKLLHPVAGAEQEADITCGQRHVWHDVPANLLQRRWIHWQTPKVHVPVLLPVMRRRRPGFLIEARRSRGRPTPCSSGASARWFPGLSAHVITVVMPLLAADQPSIGGAYRRHYRGGHVADDQAAPGLSTTVLRRRVENQRVMDRNIQSLLKKFLV